MKVESFNLDHTQVAAPYVRLAGRYRTAHGDEIRKFDLRLVQPNKQELPTAALHTLEHLVAGYLRDSLSTKSLGAKVIDVSPMGCRTGFYLTALGEPSEDEVRQALLEALRAVVAHTGAIPGGSERECGNYRDHSLPGAQAWARDILQREIIVQETVWL